MSADFSKIGRNNKNRGRKHEREVADLLGWTRVPYSGAMKDWGKADVVDGFYKKKGYWAGECKTQVIKGDGPAHLNIKAKWIAQMVGGERAGRRGILIVRRVRQGAKPGTKAPPIYVLMFEDTWDWFFDKHLSFRNGAERPRLAPATYESKLRGESYNFGVREEWLNSLHTAPTRWTALEVNVDDGYWYVMRLDDFARYVQVANLMIHDDPPSDGQ